jgi:hypothetical protein
LWTCFRRHEGAATQRAIAVCSSRDTFPAAISVPTLLAHDGRRLCYNFGRIAAFGTVFLGLFNRVGDYRLALLYAGFLFLPAGALACLLPEPPLQSPDQSSVQES